MNNIRRIAAFCVFGYACAVSARGVADPAPSIFWVSSPVRPGETVVLAGEDFGPDATVECRNAKGNWHALKTLQRSRQSLYALVPPSAPVATWPVRVASSGRVSGVKLVNAPDVRWCIDDALSTTHPGGTLRILGVCLALEDANGKRPSDAADPVLRIGGRELSAVGDSWEVRVAIPEDMQEGRYDAVFYNGFGESESFSIVVGRNPVDDRPVIDVAGLDPTGMKDCTLAIVQAIERARNLGGAILRLPAGRFRVDCGLRPGTFCPSPLHLPDRTTLCGAGMNETSLWWPDRDEPLPVMIEAGSGCSIEDLAIYAQGPMHDVICGRNELRVERVLIRALASYLTTPTGAHLGRPRPSPDKMGGNIIDLWGENNRVVGCDIIGDTANPVRVCRGEGTIIEGNTFRMREWGCLACCGASRTLAESNLLSGVTLQLSLFWSNRSENVVYRGNKVYRRFSGDHEGLTGDGHGTWYTGHIAPKDLVSFQCVDPMPITMGSKGCVSDPVGCSVHVFDGRGAGQIRDLVSFSNGVAVISRPWDVQPDATSLVSIAVFNGRHLILDNEFVDTGTMVQLYPSNNGWIVAGNKGLRVESMHVMGVSGTWYCKDADLSRFNKAELSWYNQFFDNEILGPNGWGGGQGRPDRWLGGEARLDIAGRFYESRPPEAGSGKTRPSLSPVTPKWLRVALGETELRKEVIPATRFVVVRRQRNHGGSIVVEAAVRDVLIEGCTLRGGAAQVRVQPERAHDLTAPFNTQFYDWDNAHVPVSDFVKPSLVLVRDIRMAR